MDTFIITCEHGGNRVPAPYRELFRERQDTAGLPSRLGSRCAGHGQALARPSRAPLVASTVSRLLIDLNRSVGHPQLFSAVTRAAPAADPSADRRSSITCPTASKSRSCQASGFARASRDPHFVAQLYPGARRQGARRRRGSALPPRSARGGRGVRALEGNAGGIELRNFGYAAITPMPAKETG